MLFPRREFQDVLEDLTAGRLLPGDVTAHHQRPSEAACWGDFPLDLAPKLRTALSRRGIARPYTHQAEAIRQIRSGHNVVLTTPTASGKTLCFNVPVVEHILREPDVRALYLFPTKALSQDQYLGIHELIEACEAPIKAFTFDGDTPNNARQAIREHGHIVISNPDMLHAAVLPQHTKWAKLFKNLRYVVIDELHTYRGIFGSHVAHLLRRLRRICAFHGSSPQFICCSATINNPGQLAARLTGLDFSLISESGAPLGEHHVVTYNPPVVNKQLGIRAGAVLAATNVAKQLILSGVATIVFAKSRLNVEIILKYLREALAKASLDPSLVQGYRGGYLPLHRRRIEAGLKSGRVRCVVATNALEAGVDIGSLQACVMTGYPGSIASFWQQSGRAGRRSGRSLTVFVANSSSIDQYLVNHPQVLLGQSPENARINPRNLFVLVDHAKCATFELPFEGDESFGVLDKTETGEVMEYLQTHGVVHQSGGRFHWMQRVFPANHVNLRGISEQNFAVIDVAIDKVIAEVDFRAAHTSLHTHAIYHVDSRQYQVERLDYENHKAFVRRVDPDYYTTAMKYSRVAILDEECVEARGQLSLAWGEVLVTRKFIGFKKIRFHTNETIGYGEIHLPDLEMHTTACWFDLPRPLMDQLPYDTETVVDGLKGMAHALETTASVALMCDGRDLGRAVGEKTTEAAERHSRIPGRDFDPTVYIYDMMPGGVGLAQEIHAKFEALVGQSRTLIAGCGCTSGCPGCLGPMPQYDARSREAALAVIDMVAAQLASTQLSDEEPSTETALNECSNDAIGSLVP